MSVIGVHNAHLGLGRPVLNAPETTPPLNTESRAVSGLHASLQISLCVSLCRSRPASCVVVSTRVGCAHSPTSGWRTGEVVTSDPNDETFGCICVSCVVSPNRLCTPSSVHAATHSLIISFKALPLLCYYKTLTDASSNGCTWPATDVKLT